jgi:hypothetical protein
MVSSGMRRLNEMSTTSPRVENGRIYITIRSAIRSPWEVVVRAASNAVRRFVPERWLSDLLVLAFAAFIVGATALCGLAVVSTWAPNHPTAGPMTCGDQEAGPAAFDVCGDLPCCQEMQ